MHRAAQLVTRGVSTTTRHALARALEHAELVKDKDFGFEIVGNVYENSELYWLIEEMEHEN